MIMSKKKEENQFRKGKWKTLVIEGKNEYKSRLKEPNEIKQHKKETIENKTTENRKINVKAW